MFITNVLKTQLRSNTIKWFIDVSMCRLKTR